jgi:hypothetical protein
MSAMARGIFKGPSGEALLPGGWQNKRAPGDDVGRAIAMRELGEEEPRSALMQVAAGQRQRRWGQGGAIPIPADHDP